MMEAFVHFNPYHQNCGLCEGRVKLDAILKMETWTEDMQFISEALQIKVLDIGSCSKSSYLVIGTMNSGPFLASSSFHHLT